MGPGCIPGGELDAADEADEVGGEVLVSSLAEHDARATTAPPARIAAAIRRRVINAGGVRRG
ncbi:MAG: hypothetical protein CME34_03105 [Gordonia sp.]|nr:hypothetical protein [Gordonia sp. (in: high G+C Gram-positive bacteria)]